MLPVYWYGDAIGNNAAVIRDYLQSWGYESEIYADVVHDDLDAKPYDTFLDDNAPDTAVIYHFSTGSPVNSYALENLKNIILLYHNITPYRFFEPFDPVATCESRGGREILANFAGKTTAAIGVSAYNKEELRELGFDNLYVSPLIVDLGKFGRSGQKPFDDDKKNILFVGRVAPNKRHDHLIKVFYFYKKYINPDSRLVILGGYDPHGDYYRSLLQLADSLDLHDVHFTGVVPDEKMGDYYDSADVYLSMSEHEGFCVPLLEAMNAGLPIVALARSGVADTLGSAGILINDFDPHIIAETVAEVIDNKKLQEEMIEAGKERLKDFERDKLAANLKSILENL